MAPLPICQHLLEGLDDEVGPLEGGVQVAAGGIPGRKRVEALPDQIPEDDRALSTGNSAVFHGGIREDEVGGAIAIQCDLIYEAAGQEAAEVGGETGTADLEGSGGTPPYATARPLGRQEVFDCEKY